MDRTIGMIDRIFHALSELGSPALLWHDQWDDDGGNAVAAELWRKYWDNHDPA